MIANASMPQMRKKARAATWYVMPMRLWSTVKSHDRQPVDDTRRRKTPSLLPGALACCCNAFIPRRFLESSLDFCDLFVRPRRCYPVT
jgi:hypothetical protein